MNKAYHKEEMRNLRWMTGIKRIEKIGTEEIRARAGVANISEKIREMRLSLLGHVERKTEEYVAMTGIHLEHGFASVPCPPVKRHTIFCHACPNPVLLSTACAFK